MTLKYRTLTTITAVGIGLALGWGLGTQQIKAQDAKAPAKEAGRARRRPGGICYWRRLPKGNGRQRQDRRAR